MVPKNYSIYTTKESPFEGMCRSLLFQMEEPGNIVKIVFFGVSETNDIYVDHLQILRNCVDQYFPGRKIPISYVSQKPFVGTLNAEVLRIAFTKDVFVCYGDNYLVLEYHSSRELITGGLLPPDLSASISIQSDGVFSRIEEILIKENFPINSIVRQWNYIENITLFDGHHQHYQDFNDSRGRFYGKAIWPSGYPAATGIGTQLGGIMVEFIALSGNELINKALDNPLQIAAHHYSAGVLVSGTKQAGQQHASPKFERARLIGSASRQTVYISGTAAIRGEKSWPENNVVEQARITMENIEYLTSPGNYPFRIDTQTYKLLRVYIKEISHMDDVNQFLFNRYPDIPKIYISADVCRDELLLEIEGVAEVMVGL